MFLGLLVSPFPAVSHEVIVVKDTDLKPYREAIRGFRSACACTVKELELPYNSSISRHAYDRADALVAVGTKVFRKVKVIRDIPVVYIMVMPSETAGLTADNVSGVSMDIAPETYLTSMLKLFPSASKIGVLSDPEHTGPFVEAAEAAARERGVTLVVKTIRSPREVPDLLNELRDRIDVLWMLPDSTLVNSETIDYLMLFSFENSVPVFSFAKKYVERGAVAALTVDPFDLGAQAGELSRRLTNGGKGPIRTYARNPRLIVNRKIAAKMGARVNREMIQSAETVE